MSSQTPSDRDRDLPVTPMEAQHTEIDETRDELQSLRRFTRRFVESDVIARQNTKTYLRGLHDGLSWALKLVENITKYGRDQARYDPRLVPDEEVRDAVNCHGHSGPWLVSGLTASYPKSFQAFTGRHP